MHRFYRLAAVVAAVTAGVGSVSQFDQVDLPLEQLSDTDARAPYHRKYSGFDALPTPGSCSEEEASLLKISAAENLPHHEIFLVPHTHDDVGWLYTVGGYYNKSVVHILDSVTADLGRNPEHRFIWSEIKWIEM